MAVRAGAGFAVESPPPAITDLLRREGFMIRPTRDVVQLSRLYLDRTNGR